MIRRLPNLQTWQDDIQIIFTVRRGSHGTITYLLLEYICNRAVLFQSYYDREKIIAERQEASKKLKDGEMIAVPMIIDNDYDVEQWYKRERLKMFNEVMKT